jgi:AcrR family transcriptional regulator
VPRNRQQIAQAQRRAEVLAAARRVLLAAGYVDTTMTAIAKAAGLAPNAVRWYFQDKDHVLAAVVDDLLDTHLAMEPGTDLESLIRLVRGLREFRALAPALAQREPHCAAVAACTERIHRILAERVDALLGSEGGDLAKAAVLAILISELTNPLVNQPEEALRYSLNRLTPVPGLPAESKTPTRDADSAIT